MRPYPTQEEVLAVRPDIADYLDGKSVDDYTASALAYLKRDLENRRGIVWSQVFSTAYLDNEDATGRNESNLVHLLCLRAVALVFEHHAVRASDGQWWELSHAYRADYDALLSECKLDVDTDEDGAIDEDEESATGQVFLGR